MTIDWMRQERLPHSSDRPRILLVNDDPQARYQLAIMLRAEGFDVVTAAGHESWLGLFRNCLSEPATWVSFAAANDPDIIMVDLGMASGQALFTVGALRQHPLTQHVPVVVMVGHDQPKELKTAKRLGAASYVEKPLPRAGIRVLLDAVLALGPEPPPRTGDEVATTPRC